MDVQEKLLDLVYILGVGHCGSTLLNLCLDMHSAVMGVSEIVHLNSKTPGWYGDEHVLQQPFWSNVDRAMKDLENVPLSRVPFDFRRVPDSEIKPAIALNSAALKAILQVSGKTILADASKQPHRLRDLLKSNLFKVRVIYLVRDGRALIHAYRRKYGRWSIGYRKLMRIDRAARHMKASFGSESWLTVRYEDFAIDPDTTLRNICEFVGISFEYTMLKPDTAEFNGLGGNRLRK